MAEPSSRALLSTKFTRGQTHLTTEQVTALHRYMRARRAAMLSCAPVDEQEAEALLRRAYHMAGLEPPIIRWFDSPLQFAQAFSPPLRPDQKTDAELQSERRRLWPTVTNLLCHNVGPDLSWPPPIYWPIKHQRHQKT